MKRLAQGFRGDLGVGELVHDGTLYDAQNRFDSDLPFYLASARRARGPVLELCCGTGRLTVPLAKAGIDMSGVDMAESMLSIAREKARLAGVKIRFHHGDMRRLSLSRRFKLIFIPYNSIQNTYTLPDLEKVFAGVRRHLAPGGTFIVEVFNPSVDRLVRGRRWKRAVYRFRLPDGTAVAVDELCNYDAARQVNRVTWVYRIGKNKPRTQQIDMRCFYPQELDALLKYNGFRVLRKYGNHRAAPFTSESPKQICVCRLGNARGLAFPASHRPQ